MVKMANFQTEKKRFDKTLKQGMKKKSFRKRHKRPKQMHNILTRKTSEAVKGI